MEKELKNDIIPERIQLLGFETPQQYEDALNKVCENPDLKDHLIIKGDILVLDNLTKKDLYAIRSFINDCHYNDNYNITGDDADEYYIDIDDLLDEDACIETVYFDF